ncbi:phenylacetate--CoA ligase family protein [Archaeoglobus veneficus]|uniref:Phenylacetate--CoA ligase n=1 Tax=Archaeoglobus veneficus (strain DSM 11195 / SNP6) TaxID=693661 RepID=F2KN08_ARCVS|nr:phenylacetate--CoA ligase [Archaeoglobus veneficus]AEA47284.1 Phenylacetate--CoA ligase [Archaeoglobus veneficus SNP6]
MYWDPRAEKMPQKDLQDIQERKLRALVHHAYEYSPFYRRKFKEMGLNPWDITGLKDLPKLPFTKKQDLRDNYPFGMFAVPISQIVRFHASSGTTGKPTVVGYTANDIEVWVESMCRSLTACGVTRDDIMQISYGYGLFTGGLGFHYAAERIGATVLPTSAGNTQRQIELMRDLHSTVIACTPSYMLYLAEYASKAGISIADDTKLRMGIFGAEPWSEETRKRIEEKTGITAYDVYGTSELSGPLFTECQERQGLHIWADHFLIEIIDPETGEQVGEGEKGELVVTTLSKEAMPLIRWRTGDITIMETEKCACGRTHPRILRILGRADDMIIVRGVNVFPSQIEHVLMQIPEVGEHYMIILDRAENGLDIMTVQVELSEKAFTDKVSDILELEKRIAEHLKAVLNVTAKVEIVNPGTLQRFEGKAKRVIDRRKI